MAAVSDLYREPGLDLTEQDIGSGDFRKLRVYLSWWGRPRKKSLAASPFFTGDPASPVGSPLQALSLQGHPLGAKGAEAIAGALAGRLQVSQLNLSMCLLGAEGGEKIATALKKNSSVTCLDLTGNALGDRGVAGFCYTLSANRSLVNLVLDRNGVSAAGAESLGKGFHRNNSLTSLSLKGNRLGDEGPGHLTDAVRSGATTALERLELDDNGIRGLGAQRLVAELGDGAPLRYLSLRMNEVLADGAWHLAAAARRCALLASLDLEYCCLG
eukprot:CAMPEP_0179274292 /NCGR_PEP_ID=MMETSP0797-20121207/33452_1 /TAXON_ID=47934 /ORGANISM="Dinophysis acuminata, Strain DAEP01" /LENGTH=270 /DNA_ID=CAMNT_0020982743 /DNA_START=16 /DNA_END=825 /DNA_ORIENTATION=+